MTTYTPVYSIDSVDVLISRTSPQFISITAKGRASSTGWTAPLLSLRHYFTPPDDGIQEFNFLAIPPTDIVNPTLWPLSTTTEHGPVQVGDYWGKGRPLRGIRVIAQTNSRTVLTEVAKPEQAQEANGMTPPMASYSRTEEENNAPRFRRDIRPLFRPRDVNAMKAAAGFDLHNYDDVAERADDILERLKIDMPCDGLWSPADIALFAAWIEADKPK